MNDEKANPTSQTEQNNIIRKVNFWSILNSEAENKVENPEQVSTPEEQFDKSVI